MVSHLPERSIHNFREAFKYYQTFTYYCPERARSYLEYGNTLISSHMCPQIGENLGVSVQ